MIFVPNVRTIKLSRGSTLLRNYTPAIIPCCIDAYDLSSIILGVEAILQGTELMGLGSSDCEAASRISYSKFL